FDFQNRTPPRLAAFFQKNGLYRVTNARGKCIRKGVSLSRHAESPVGRWRVALRNHFQHTVKRIWIILGIIFVAEVAAAAWFMHKYRMPPQPEAQNTVVRPANRPGK